MNNRLTQLFQAKQQNLLSVYYTAGYPQLDDTVRIAEHLQQAGADIIEIGMPYSDPLADGPTIQQSGAQALANGMTISKLFDQLESVRATVSLPLILMGYLNPAMQYGLERFCEQCQRVGIDALIIPDLPMQEYLNEYKELFETYGLYNIFLVSPQTSDERIRLIDEHSHGFVYVVSSASITGAKSGITDVQIAYFERIQRMHLRNPTLIGFGISDRESFETASQYANGAIVGSAFIKALVKGESLEKDIHQFIKRIKR